MTRTPMDYSQQTIAGRMASLQTARERQDDRLVRRTNVAVGAFVALLMGVLLIVQVLPAVGVIQ